MNESGNPYELTFEERPGYLYALIRSETIDSDTALAYLREIAERCKALNCEHLVVERDIPVMLSAGDLFFTTERFIKMMGGIRVAFVNPHANNADELGFAMIIGTNRGAKFTVHSDIASAEKWLLR